MTTRRTFVVSLAVALASAASLDAQTPASASAQIPTKHDPIRLRAFAVGLDSGVSGIVEISIERWTMDEEREGLLAALMARGQDKLLDALQDVKVRCGYLRTANSLGWDIKYARENMLSGGTRQIVIVTDKPVSFLAAAAQARTLDYPFTLLELRMTAGQKGEGRMLAQTAIEIKNGRLELENYGNEPVRLTEIKQEGEKKKR
jgi:hypothetical protein